MGVPADPQASQAAKWPPLDATGLHGGREALAQAGGPRCHCPPIWCLFLLPLPLPLG